MPVAANHVVRQEVTRGLQRLMDLVEQNFEFDEMMQRLNGKDHIVLPRRFPGIDIERAQRETIREAFLGGGRLGPLQDLGVDVHTFKRIILDGVLA